MNSIHYILDVVVFAGCGLVHCVPRVLGGANRSFALNTEPMPQGERKESEQGRIFYPTPLAFESSPNRIYLNKRFRHIWVREDSNAGGGGENV